jgi:hypothetical protein
MTIAAAPVPAAGYGGACKPLDQATTRIIGSLDTGPVALPTTTAYGAWTNVPDGTAYVTFTYGSQRAWQRPIAGVSYFAVTGATPPLGGTPVILRAFATTGTELGRATEQPILNGAGQWQWS